MDSTQINNSNTLEALDCISRQAAQHKTNALIDEFETIMKEIRERNVDDSVCGLCEYDGAFISDSGNWCNECPGFERDDCFKLKDQYREEWVGSIKNLPPVQPKRGKWIDAVIPNDNGDLLVQVCDQCNTFFPLAYTGGGHHFCPNCGADMKGGKNGTD